MSDAIIGLAGALVGGLAAVAGAALQARSAASLQAKRAEEDERRRDAETAERLQERQRELARRYLFQLGDAVDSLLHRFDNWLREGGQDYAEERSPGYWEPSTLYAVARALAAERILSLEAVYLDLQALWPTDPPSLPTRAVEDAFRDSVGQRFFQYDRLALSEAVLAWESGGFRLLVYSEFRLRYEEPAWNQLLEPAREVLTTLTKHQLGKLERRLSDVKQRIDETTKPRVSKTDALSVEQ